MATKKKLGGMKLFKDAIKANVRLNTKYYGVKHLFEIKGVPSQFDTRKLVETKRQHLIWELKTEYGGDDYFLSSDIEIIQKYGNNPELFRPGECKSLDVKDWSGINFSGTSKSPVGNNVMLCCPDETQLRVPTDWYMLTAYDDINIEMLYEMNQEQLSLVRLNENISDTVRMHLDSLLNGGNRD